MQVELSQLFHYLIDLNGKRIIGKMGFKSYKLQQGSGEESVTATLINTYIPTSKESRQFDHIFKHCHLIWLAECQLNNR